jgi:gliding motility-associated-like protein/uncharacterized repeat protein (TIGR01451 family)
VDAGNELEYGISISNRGIGTAFDLVIEDVLPSGTSYLSSTPAGTVSGNTIRWQLDSLSGGDSTFYVLRLRVSPSFAVGTSVRNTAILISGDVPGGVLEAEAEPVLVTRKTLVGISKELLGTNPAYPGDTVGYRIRVWNAAPGDSDVLRAVDVLATGLEYISSESGVYDGSNREVEWTVLGLSPGDTVSYLLSVRVSPSAAPGFIGNTAVLRNSTGGEEDSDTAQALEVIPHLPELYLSKSSVSGLTVDAGNELEYGISISNRGIGTAYDLVIEDALPSGTSYVSSTPAGTVSGTAIRWQLDSLSGGDSTFYVLRLRVSPSFAVGTSVRNTADLISGDVPGGVLEAEAEPVLVNRKASVGISKELLGTNPAYPGDTVGYRIRVWNAGPSDSDVLRAVDMLATGLEYISSESGVYDGSNRQVEWTVSGLSPGDTVSYLLNVRVSPSAAPGFIGNTAVLRNSTGEEQDADTSEAVEVVPDNRTGLFLQKSLHAGEIRVGSDYQYRIFLKNIGSKKLTNLVVTDTLDQNLSYISSNLLLQSNVDGVLRWEVAELDPGDSISIDILVSLEYQKELIGSVINNQVWVSSVNYEQIWFAEVNSVILPPNPTELIASKILNQDLVSVGDLIDYSISVRTTGENIAYDLIIRDLYPKGLLYVGMQGPGKIEVYADSLLVMIDRILPGEEVKIQLSFVLTEFSEQMVNIAQLTSENTPDVEVVADAIKLKEVELEVLKTVSDEFVEVGRELSYLLSIANNSQVNATEVIVTDILPSEVEYIRYESSKGSVSFSISDRKIEWLLDSLQAGERAELRLFVKAVKVESQVMNSVNISSKEQDSDYINNEDVIFHSQIELHFPNVFTPNGDGVNDQWEITGLEAFPDNTLQIVNRWGVRVFEAKRYTNNWTGDNLLKGTYFYLFKWRDNANTSYEQTGFITLIR